MTFPKWIGRFPQEDTYRGDGLNLYAYCANNPVMYYDPSGFWKLCPDGKYEPTGTDKDRIRAYRDLDMEELRKILYDADPDLLLELFLADPEYIVEMPFVGKDISNGNSQGWKRDAKYFFTELSNAHPELFSSDNLDRIAKGGLPKVDDHFLQYFPQYKDYENEILVHHHIGGGGQAMPIPMKLHEGFGIVHNVEKLLGIWGGIDQEIFSEMIQNIKDITIRTRNWKNMRIK